MAEAAELISHVQDSQVFHLPFGLELPLPQPLAPWGIYFTKYMALEVLAAVLMVLIFVPLARRMVRGGAPRGRLWNIFELMLLFIRDEVARPAIGRRYADRFLPFLWTMFFFILVLNLIGMLPWTGSATGTLSTTGTLAAITFLVVIASGMKKFGVLGYWAGQVPHMDVPLVLGIFLKPMIFGIEVLGLCVKHFILAMRLFANMFAGHLVLAVIVGFIAQSAHQWLWYGVAPASVLGATALSLLELMVAFLQAYVFTFLAALFIGMAVHQH